MLPFLDLLTRFIAGSLEVLRGASGPGTAFAIAGAVGALGIASLLVDEGSEELDKKFVKEAEAAQLSGLKGHRLLGGLRASVYNAQTDEAIDALLDFMREFEKKNLHTGSM